VLKVDAFPWARFPHKVSYRDNCNALRGIGHTAMSELRRPFQTARPVGKSRKPGTCVALAARRMLRVRRHVLRL
jgi:hypothetical protein